MISSTLLAVASVVCQVGPITLQREGDETSVVRMKADPAAFVGKRIILSGNAEIFDIYQGLYRDAQKSHVSIKFNELGENANQVGETALLYIHRETGKAAIEALIARQEKRVGERIPLRALVTLKAAAFKDAKEWDKLELLDVQLAEEGTDPIRWQPWIVASGEL